MSLAVRMLVAALCLAVPAAGQLPALFPPLAADLKGLHLNEGLGPPKRAERSAAAPPRRPLKRIALTAALAVGSGAVAWWAKREADAAYETYLASVSTRRQDRNFKRAEQYDRIAGGAFLAMEGAIVLGAYWSFF